MKKYRELHNKDKLYIQKEKKGLVSFFIGCCGCELVHKWEVEQKGKGIYLCIQVDNRRTAQRRRWRKRQKEVI